MEAAVQVQDVTVGAVADSAGLDPLLFGAVAEIQAEAVGEVRLRVAVTVGEDSAAAGILAAAAQVGIGNSIWDWGFLILD